MLVVVVLGVAQVAPVNWEVQVQTKPSPYRKQVPPFKHGFVAQALRIVVAVDVVVVAILAVSQVIPVHCDVQPQKNEFPVL